MHQIEHDHIPLYRVVRAGWAAPLDTSYSYKSGGRWNPPGTFHVLYTCCSETVARDIALDLLEVHALTIEDLNLDFRPQLVEVEWNGGVVDLVSAEGVKAAGFPREYPEGVGHDQTQPKAVIWHTLEIDGVVCRSASRLRAGFSQWEDPHEPWAELAIFVEKAEASPRLLARRGDHGWLTQPTTRDG